MLNGNNKIVDWGILLDAYIYLGFHKKSFSNVLDRIMHRFSYEKSSKFHHLRITQFGRLYIWSLSFFFLLNTTWILVWKKKNSGIEIDNHVSLKQLIAGGVLQNNFSSWHLLIQSKNGNTKAMCEIYSKLTVKTLISSFWCL